MVLGRLVLLRHAKSAYPPGVPDHDRPLNARGERDARAAGRAFEQSRDDWLGAQALVLVSSAMRAQQTWQLASPGLAGIDAQTESRLYEASVSTLIDIVAPSIEAGTSTLVVAHNPGLEDLAAHLTGADASPERAMMLQKYPTSAIAVLELLDARWSDTSARLVDFVVPRG